MSDTVMQAFVDFGGNLAPLQKSIGELRGMVGTAVSQISKIGSGIGISPAAIGVVGGIGAIVGAIKKALDAEANLAKLKGALSSTGQAVDSNMAKFKQLANEISQVTTASKGEVREVILAGMQHGLSAEKSAQYTRSAMGLAKALGMDAKTAMTELIKQSNGMRSALDKQIPALAGAKTQTEKLAIINRLAAQGMEQMFGEGQTTKGGIEQLSKSVGALYGQFGELFLPIVNQVVKGMQGLLDWVQQVVSTFKQFGFVGGETLGSVSGAVSGLGETAGSVFSTIGEYAALAVREIAKIPHWFEGIAISIAQAFDTAVNYVSAFGQNIVIAIKWAMENWRDILATGVNYVATIVGNIGTNIKNFWQAVMDFIAGRGFSFNWTSLTEGFQSEIKKMPEFVQAESAKGYDEVWRQWGEKGEQYNQQWAKGFASNAKKSADEVKNNIRNAMAEGGGIHAERNIKEEKQKDKSDTGKFTDLQSIWKNLQTAVMKSAAEKDAARTANATERIAKASEDTNKKIDKLQPKGMDLKAP